MIQRKAYCFALGCWDRISFCADMSETIDFTRPCALPLMVVLIFAIASSTIGVSNRSMQVVERLSGSFSALAQR